MTSRSIFRLIQSACAITGLYACSGNTGSSPAAAPAPANASVAPTSANALPAGVTARMVAQGDSIFHAASCKGCHGDDAMGTVKAPNLTIGKWSQLATGSYDEIVQLVTTGVPKDKVKLAGAPYGMNPRGGRPVLTDEQIKAVAAYVYTLSRGKA